MICTIKACGKKHQARGYCMNHYIQARNKGEFTPMNSIRECGIGDCEKLKYGKDYCLKHHRQMSKYGRLLTTEDKSKQGKKARASSNGNKGMRWGSKESTHKERARFNYTCRPLVLQRDNYTCQMCHEESENLHVDHLKSWAKYPELRFEVDNCRTLCAPCHYYITFKRKMPSHITWGQTQIRRTI